MHALWLVTTAIFLTATMAQPTYKTNAVHVLIAVGCTIGPDSPTCPTESAPHGIYSAGYSHYDSLSNDVISDMGVVAGVRVIYNGITLGTYFTDSYIDASESRTSNTTVCPPLGYLGVPVATPCINGDCSWNNDVQRNLDPLFVSASTTSMNNLAVSADYCLGIDPDDKFACEEQLHFDRAMGTCTWGDLARVVKNSATIIAEQTTSPIDYFASGYSFAAPMYSMWAVCLPFVPAGAILRPFLISKALYVPTLMSTGHPSYPQWSRCHQRGIAPEDNHDNPINYFNTVPYAPVESMDGTVYDGESSFVILSPRFCELSGKTEAVSVGASTGMSPSTVYVRFPPTMESWVLTAKVVMLYVIDGTDDIVEYVSQFLEHYMNVDDTGYGASAGGLSNYHIFIVGIPETMESRVDTFSPIVITDASSNPKYGSWPNDAPRVQGYASGSKGIRFAARTVTEVESTVMRNSQTFYGAPTNSGTNYEVAARLVIGVGVAGTTAIYNLRRRLACGSLDMATAIDPERWFGSRDAVNYTEYVKSNTVYAAMDSLAENQDYTTAYSLKKKYDHLWIYQSVCNATDAMDTVGTDAETLGKLGINSTSTDYDTYEVSFNTYGEWQELLTYGSLRMLKALETFLTEE